MKFSEFNLIANEQQISNLDFFSNKEDDRYNFDKTEYVVNFELIDQNVFWIYARYGKEKPYSEEVLDIETKKFGKNPKLQNQIELKNQLFCIFVLSEQILYMSDHQKQNFLCSYLNSRFNKKFIIKKYIVNPEQFVAEITSIEKIQFFAKKNIFNQEGIFGEIEDVLGLGSVAQFELRAKMDGNIQLVRQKCLNFIRSFAKKRDDHQITKMQCIGKDDRGIERIFNIENYMIKNKIDAKKDENGMYCPEQVKDLVLKKIKDETNAK